MSVLANKISPSKSAKNNLNPLTALQAFSTPTQPVVSLQSTIGNKAVREMVGHTNPPIQRSVKAKLTTETESSKVETLPDLAKYFSLTVPDVVAQVKTLLFQGTLFPDIYKDNYAENTALQGEIRQLIAWRVEKTTSTTVLDAATGDATEVGRQLHGIISPAINATLLNKNCNHYRNLSALNGEQGADYLPFIELAKQKLAAYTAQSKDKYDEKGMMIKNRIEKFKEIAEGLFTEIKDIVAGKEGATPLDELMPKVRRFVAEITEFENAWDLDFLEGTKKLDSKINKLSSDSTDDDVKDHYKEGGGTDDGESVKDDYGPLLACSLFAILALKPNWLGGNGPNTESAKLLHRTLRKTEQLKDYDDNRAAAKVRYLAGLTPTDVSSANQGVVSYLAAKKLAAERSNQTPESFIIDAKDMAHTFAAKWDTESNKYVKVDETGTKGGFGEYASNKVLVIWK